MPVNASIVTRGYGAGQRIVKRGYGAAAVSYVSLTNALFYYFPYSAFDPYSHTPPVIIGVGGGVRDGVTLGGGVRDGVTLGGGVKDGVTVGGGKA